MRENKAEAVRVFIDTQVFVRHGYEFARDNFQALACLAAEGHVQILLPEATRMEIEDDLKERVRNAKTKALKLLRGLPVLAELEAGTQLANEETWQELEKRALGKFTDFCETVGVVEVPLDGVVPSKILSAYFAGYAPFGSQKKREFLDAFAAEALKAYCEAEKCNTVVVSGDADWRAICEESCCFEYCERLGEFLSRFPDQRVVYQLKTALERKLHVVSVKVKEKFEWSGFIVEETDGDVEDVDVLELRPLRVSIPEVKAGRARAEVEYGITYSAWVTYDVPGTGWYDSEDKMVYGVERDSIQIEKETLVTVEVNLEYDESDPTQVHLVSVGPETSSNFLVSIADELGWNFH